MCWKSSRRSNQGECQELCCWADWCWVSRARTGVLEWSLKQGMGSARESGVTVPGSLFWNMQGTWEWEVFLPWGKWTVASGYGFSAWRCTCVWRAVWGCWGRKAVCLLPVPQYALAVCMQDIWCRCGQSWTSCENCLALLSTRTHLCGYVSCLSVAVQWLRLMLVSLCFFPQWAGRVSSGAALLLCPWSAQTLQWIYSAGLRCWTSVPSSPLPAQVSP